jgi:hypothetical protein
LERQYRPGQTTVYDFTPFSEQVRRVKLAHDKNRKKEGTSQTSGVTRHTSGVIRQASSLPEGPPTLEAPAAEGAEEILRGTPAENFPPPRKVSAPEEQKKEQKEKKKTTTRVSNDTVEEREGAGAFFNFEEQEKRDASRVMRHTSRVTRHTSDVTHDESRMTHDASLPQDLREKAQALGFRGRKNWTLLAQVYGEDPERVRHWVEALAEGRVEAQNPPGLLLVALREGYPAPPPPEPEFGPADPDCERCLGTGTPLVDGHWQHGAHCRCTWPEGYVPPERKKPQEKPPDPDCAICSGTGTPLVDGHWQWERRCGCTRVED